MVKRILQRKDAGITAWMAQREGEAWCLARTSLDHASIGYAGGFEARIHDLAEWQSDRHGNTEHEPRADKVEFRKRCPGLSLRGTCQECEAPPTWLLYESELCRRRPGAVHPLDACTGCVYSFVGELEIDKSLRAAGLG